MKRAAMTASRFLRRFWRGFRKSGTGFSLSVYGSWSRQMARRIWRGLRKSGTGFSLSVYGSWSRRMARRIWRGLREWCGDAAYESYLRSKGTRSGSHHTLTPEEFYVEQLNRRYSRPTRCC